MNKKALILLSILVILLLGIFRIVNPRISKEVASLDCKAIYQKSIFKREYEGYNYFNGKMDLSKCLCERYLNTKDEKYRLEIQKILVEFEFEKVDELNFEEICNDRESYFSYRYYE